MIPNTTKQEINIYTAYKTQKKFRDFDTKEELAMVNALFIRWANYVGANTPDATELNTLSNFVKRNFGALNAFDLKECIELLASGGLGDAPQHYGKISPIYINEVLKKYQEYKMNVVYKIKDAIEKEEGNKTIQISDEDRVKNFKKLLTYAKEESTKGLFYSDAGDSIYNFVKFNKLINLDKTLIEEAKKFGEKSYTNLRQKKALEATIGNTSYKSVEDLKFEKEDIIRKNAREYVVNRWLSNLDLKEIIEKINIKMLLY